MIIRSFVISDHSIIRDLCASNYQSTLASYAQAGVQTKIIIQSSQRRFCQQSHVHVIAMNTLVHQSQMANECVFI